MAFFPDSPPITGADITDLFASDITKNSVTATVIASRAAFGTPYGEVNFTDTDSTASLVAHSVIDGSFSVTPKSGATGTRPVPASNRVGQFWFDTTLGLPIFWTGTGWVKADGTPA